MLNHKLLVFIIAVPIITILTADFYQNGESDKTEDVTPDLLIAQADDMGITVNIPPELLGGSVNAEKIKATLNFPAEMFDGPVPDSTPNHLRKLICFGKLNLLLDAYRALSTITEADFNQLCKNVTEINDCYSKADYSGQFKHNTLFGVIHDFHTCFHPYFQTAYNFCQLTYADADYTQQCFMAAIKRYSGSPEETECREECCPDMPTSSAADPMKCRPSTVLIYGGMRPCEKPVVNQPIKDNDCLRACLAKSWARFARHACGAEAARIVKVYEKRMSKKVSTAPHCFEMCPEA